MYPKQHILFGIVFSLLLLVIYPQINLIGLSLFFLSSVLIDVDHYLYYVYKKRDVSLKNAHSVLVKNKKKILALPRNQRNEIYGGIYFLHGMEILLIILLLSGFVSKYFFFIFLGFSFHLIFDIADAVINFNRLDKLSLIYDYFKFKQLKLLDK